MVHGIIASLITDLVFKVISLQNWFFHEIEEKKSIVRWGEPVLEEEVGPFNVSPINGGELIQCRGCIILVCVILWSPQDVTLLLHSCHF